MCQTAEVLQALRGVCGTAAEIALNGAGGSPNLSSDLLLNTYFPVVQIASVVFLDPLCAGNVLWGAK